MSKQIEERVVSMKFENSDFKNKTTETVSLLDRLKKALKLDGASKGLENVSSSAKKIDLSNVGNSADSLKGKFSALEVVGVTALVNIANSAIETGKQLLSAITIDPIIEGFHEYETQMNAVQTILANTSSKGSTLEDVNKTLDELNTYADKTIYNFTEMTRNIGTFTAAGVDLDTSAKAIKGIANLAAMSGSSSQQASSAMYQLSQAIASGRVNLEDWNSVVNAGMGGQVFQDALKRTAKAMGKTVDEAQSFRESLSSRDGNGWLTSDVLLETLKEFTGDMSEAELRAQGYTESQIQDIMSMAQTAQDAATKVKTFTQLIDTLKEALGSGWTQTWEILIGDFNEAKELFTGISNVLGKMINDSAEARNKMLQGWKDLGGRTDLIESFKNVATGLLDIFKSIGGAFRDIFPPTTSEQLYKITSSIRSLTENFKMSETTLNNLRSTFKGLFAIIDIGKQLFVGLAKGIGTIIGGCGSLGSSILTVTGSFGEWLTALDNVIKQSDIINKVIQPLANNIRNLFTNTGLGISSILTKLAEIRNSVVAELNFKPWESFQNCLKNLGEVVSYISKKIDYVEKKISDFMSNIGSKFGGLDISGSVKSVFDGLTKLFVDEGKEVEDSGEKMSETFSKTMDNFVGNVGKLSIAALGYGLTRVLASVSRLLNKEGGLGKVLEEIKDVFSKNMGKVTDTLDGVQKCLQSYQDRLKADILIKIAAAIGILAASIVSISLIDSNKLGSSLAAIGGLFAQLLVASKLYSKIGEFKSSAIKSSTVMISMATSILILSSAMRKIGDLDITQTLTSLTAILAMTAMMSKVASSLSTNGSSFMKGSTGMIAFALAIKVLGSACKDLSGLDFTSMIKGITGLGAVMAEMSLFLNKTNFSSVGIKSATGIVIIASSLKIMASACKDLGDMDWSGILKGVTGIGAILAEVSIFSKYTTNTSGILKISSSMVIMAGAMNVMYYAMQNIGNMDWSSISKSVTGIGTVLAEIAIFDKFSGKAQNVLKTSTSLVVIAGAMNVMYYAMQNIGSMDWSSITKGLVGMGGALAEISLFANFTGKAENMIKSSIALGVMAGAMTTLGNAFNSFGSMDWGSIAKGLIGMGGALAEVSLSLNTLPKNMPSLAFGLIEVGTALNIIGEAMKSIGSLSWEGLIKSLVGTGIALTEISIALKMIPNDTIWTALGLTAVASALVTLSQALTTLSGLTWEGIAKGLAGIGGSLLILGGAIQLMNGCLGGVAAVIAVSAALNLLVPPILNLSSISWDGLIKSLVTLAGTLATFGIAAAVLTPVIPSMTALAGSLTLLGVAALGVGAGIALASEGLLALSNAFLQLEGTSAEGAQSVTTAIGAIIEGIANGIPSIIAKIGEGISAFLQYIIESIPKFAEVVTKLITSLCDVIVTCTPKIVDTVLQTLSKILDALVQWGPSIVQKGLDILLQLLQILSSKMGDFTNVAVNICVAFINGISNKIGDIVQAGFNFVISFVNALADAVRNNAGAVADAAINLVSAFIDAVGTMSGRFFEAGVNAVEGFINGLLSLPGRLWDAGCEIGRKALAAAKSTLDEHSPSKEMEQVGIFADMGLINGLKMYANKVYDSGYNVGKQALTAVKDSMKRMNGLIDDPNYNPTITPVLDLTNVQNGVNEIDNMLNSSKFGTSVNLANNASDLINRNNTKDIEIKDLRLDTKINKPNKPAIIQLMLNDARVLAEAMVKDTDELIGNRTIMYGRRRGLNNV